MGKLDGKVAIITGAAVGLGEGIAEAYVKYGAKICMVDLSEDVEQTAQRLRNQYQADIITYVGNVADKNQMKEAVQKTVDTFGEVNIACCNAGVCRLAPFEQYQRCMEYLSSSHSLYVKTRKRKYCDCFFRDWRYCG